MTKPCTHDLAEQETATVWDGLCPICLKEEVDRLRNRITKLENKIRKNYNPISQEQFLLHQRQKLLGR